VIFLTNQLRNKLQLNDIDFLTFVIELQDSTVIIDDPAVMKEMFNDMAFNGRPSNDWYKHISHEGHGNNKSLILK